MNLIELWTDLFVIGHMPFQTPLVDVDCCSPLWQVFHYGVFDSTCASKVDAGMEVGLCVDGERRNLNARYINWAVASHCCCHFIGFDWV